MRTIANLSDPVVDWHDLQAGVHRALVDVPMQVTAQFLDSAGRPVLGGGSQMATISILPGSCRGATLQAAPGSSLTTQLSSGRFVFSLLFVSDSCKFPCYTVENINPNISNSTNGTDGNNGTDSTNGTNSSNGSTWSVICPLSTPVSGPNGTNATAPPRCANCTLIVKVLSLNKTINDFLVVPGVPNEMRMLSSPSNVVVLKSLLPAPKLRLRDGEGFLLSASESVYVELIQGVYMAGPSSASLILPQGSSNRNDTVGGIVEFNGLSVSSPGQDYRLSFTRCPAGTLFSRTGCCLTASAQEACFMFGMMFSVVETLPFRIDNSRIGLLAPFEDLLGQRLAVPTRVLASVTFSVGVRVLDESSLALASRPYTVTCTLRDAQGVNQTQYLVGPTVATTSTDFSSLYAGGTVFSDLKLLRAGNGFTLEFAVVPYCLEDLDTTNLDECASRRLTSSVKLILPGSATTLSVLHGIPTQFVFVKQPPNVTEMRNVPAEVITNILDENGNLASCQGVTAADTEFIYNNLVACQDPAFNTAGRFLITASVVQGCLARTSCLPTSPLTAATLLGAVTQPTFQGRTEFKSLMVSSAGFAFRLSLTTTLFGGGTVTGTSAEFNSYGTKYDFVNVTGCPNPSRAYTASEVFSPQPFVEGVYSYANVNGVQVAVRSSTDSNVCDANGLCQPGTVASAEVCKADSGGQIVCGQALNPPLYPTGATQTPLKVPGSSFVNLGAPRIAAGIVVLRFTVSSPFEPTRSVSFNCPPFEVVPSFTGSMLVDVQPSALTDAGLPFPQQPALLLLDGDNNPVEGTMQTVTTQLCLPCPCPCQTLPVTPGIMHGACQSGRVVGWTLFASNELTVCDAANIEAGTVSSSSGRAEFSKVRARKAAEKARLLFSLLDSPSINVSSQELRILPCTPNALSFASTGPGIAPVSDTGRSLCDGADCVLQVTDAFGNRAYESVINITATLTPTPHTPLAGFGVSTRCGCTGNNSGVTADMPKRYGTTCGAWDSQKDCEVMWPMCQAGEWCCRAWCYVHPSCPHARPDVKVPGLFYAYEACSGDERTERECFWQTQTVCPHRNTSGVKKTPFAENLMRGGARRATSRGTAVFTNLYVDRPGKYIVTFQTQTASQVLTWRSNEMGVTPIYARQLRFIASSDNGTFVGDPLFTQPVIEMLDSFGNPLLNTRAIGKVCSALTAYVSTWNELPNTPASPRPPDRFIFGQTMTSGARLFPDRCDTDPNQKCFVTANALDGVVSYRRMTVGGGAANAIVVNFTSGCCDPNPAKCTCPDPDVPTTTDKDFLGVPIYEPCAWVATPIFSVKRPIRYLSLLAQPSVTYIAGAAVNVSIRLLDETSTPVLGANDAVNVSLAEGKSTLQGRTVVNAADGVAVFTDLRVTGLDVSSFFRLSFSLQASYLVSIVANGFTMLPSRAVSVHVNTSAPVIVAGNNIEATIFLRDEFGNVITNTTEAGRVNVSIYDSLPDFGGADLENPLVSAMYIHTCTYVGASYVRASKAYTCVSIFSHVCANSMCT